MPRSREDRVGLERRRPVRTLGDHPRPQARRVVRRDLILAGSEHEDVAVELEQLLVRTARPRRSPRASLLAARTCQRRDVEPVLGVDPPEMSETATTVAPRACSSGAAMPPTLPKP